MIGGEKNQILSRGKAGKRKLVETRGKRCRREELRGRPKKIWAEVLKRERQTERRDKGLRIRGENQRRRGTVERGGHAGKTHVSRVAAGEKSPEKVSWEIGKAWGDTAERRGWGTSRGKKGLK